MIGVDFLAIAPDAAGAQYVAERRPVACPRLLEHRRDGRCIEVVGTATRRFACRCKQSQPCHGPEFRGIPTPSTVRDDLWLLARNSLHDVTVARFLLVRHGQSEWNAAGRMQGHADSPLTPEGRRQAHAAARKLKGFHFVASSDLSRAADTAAIIAAELSLPLIAPQPALREIDVGPWQGLTRRDIDKRFPGYLENHMRPPGYESDESVFERVRFALITLADMNEADSGGRSDTAGLVVTHSGVIRVMRRVLGFPDQRNHRNLEGCWFSLSAEGKVSVEESINVLRNATISNTL